MNSLKIGIIVGKGTGKELKEVFVNFVTQVGKYLGKKIELKVCDYEFNTYNSLIHFDPFKAKQICKKELIILKNFYQRFFKENGRIIFKTAINAETLYRLRKWGKCIKIIPISIENNRKILILRDEMQGYYTNDRYYITNDKIVFCGSFLKNNFRKLLILANSLASKYLGKTYETWFVYKHHLFSNIMEKWIIEFAPTVRLIQPNHMTQMLLDSDKRINKNIAIIIGNEIGDILHEVLLYVWGIGKRETSYCKNIYLNKNVEGLIEYQTVHGSADELEGKDKVIPIATLKIAGEIFEEFCNVKGFYSLVERAIQKVYSNILYSDIKTSIVVERVLECIIKELK